MAIVHCPICKKEAVEGSPYIPFCSDRCRLIDLGNWASEKYVVSTPAERDDLEELESPEARESRPR
ncbi:MAG: DNA gyrase inhibitor YacG [Acidobacteriaceae bacterium]|nr:DNA gyrase inhibitor YacG [Acidobacteriaceae bacterium]